MAQEQPDEILLTIKVSEEDLQKKILAAREAISRLRKERTELNKDLKNQTITVEEHAKSLEAIETHWAQQNAIIKESKKTLADYDKATKSAQGSLDQMRAKVALLNPLVAQLSKEQRESAGEGRAQVEALAALTEELKKAEQSYGVFSRNVGNYGEQTKEAEGATVSLEERIASLSEEFAEQAANVNHAGSSMGELYKRIARLNEEYEGLTQAQRDNKAIGGVLLNQINALEKAQDKNNKTVEQSKKSAKDYIKDINVLGINVGSTVDSFKSGAMGAQTFAKAIFSGRGALIALTAVPIVLVLTALVTLLTKSQKGMDFLAQATGAVSAVFSLLTQKVIAVGSTIVGLFTNTKQTLTDLGNFIEQNLINRFKAFGVILEAIKSGDLSKITDGFIQLGTGVTDATAKAKNFTDEIGKAAKAGIDLAKASQAIEEAEIALDVQRGKSLVTIEKNKQLSEDTTKSAATRVAAAKKAFGEEEKLQKAEQALQLKRIKLLQEEAKANGNLRADRAKVAKAQEEYQKIEADAISRRTEINNNINSINAEAEAKALENAKKAAQERVNQAEVALIVARRKGEDIISIEREVYQRTLEFIEKKRNAELVGVKKGSQERKLIIERANTEQLEATKAFAAKVADITYNARVSEINSTLALVRKGSKEEEQLRIESIEVARNKQQAAIEAQQRNIEKQYKAGILSAKQYQEAKSRLEIENGNIVNNAARAISDTRLAYERDRINKEAELQAQALQVELELGDQTLEHERDIAGKRIELERETQLKLLALEDITQDEREKREAAIEATAKAKRRELAEQRVADARTTALAISDIELSIAKEGSKRQLEEQKKRLKIERDQAIAAAKGNRELIAEIEKDFQDKSKKAQEKYNYTLYEKVVITANQIQATLSSVVDAQTARQTKALDDQQEAILSSAALSADARAKIEADFTKKREKIEREAAEKRKRIASLENLIATAQGITASFKLLPPFSYINAALVAAQGIAQQVVIDNTKFAKGGPVFGPSHEQGGIKMFNKSGAYYGEFEGEEIILTKGVYRDPVLRAKASALNVAGGGRAFAGPTYRTLSLPKYAGPVYNTQHATPQFRYGGTLAGFDTNTIAAAIVQGMQWADIRVSVDEITKAQSNVKKTQVNNDLGYNQKS